MAKEPPGKPPADASADLINFLLVMAFVLLMVIVLGMARDLKSLVNAMPWHV